ncbi:MAG: hypothetical protein KatS3mg110_2029 [Pirellulaceae bacterium]|nr:MAG: hypothetical protein KatS3mg110_2029 [Pirellulaceae bacterium]
MSDKIRRSQILFLTSVPGPEAPAWRPRADLYRTPSGWLVKLELAGVDPDDIRVSFCGGQLVVEGTRRDELLVHGCQCHRLEIAYSRFERQWQLPDVEDPAEIRTSFHQGMLIIEIISKTGEGR